MRRVLNLYAGLGGNRKHWDADVVAVESNPKIAAVYQGLYPQDEVIVDDAHQFLLDNYDDGFHFIWSSPPCQTHSKMNKATRHKLRRYVDLMLYEEILFLQDNAECNWVVENVVPYYQPFVPPTNVIGRHVFWSNFLFLAEDVKRPADFINLANLAGKQKLMDWLGIHYEENIYYGGNHCPAQILRNCVHPDLGAQIFNQCKT
jgi:DNA (cytosine-5)-methyltransferase 1